MTFLQPFILWGLPLVLLPVIIHLLNRMRHRSQQWAAMRFLISATRSSVSNAKLRQFLILFCRVMAVGALILFLARPLAGGWLGWALSPAPDVIVMLLDRSASMETVLPNDTETKRERAVRLLSETAKPFADSSHFVLIDSALRAAQELTNPKDWKELSATGPTDTGADIPSLLQSAANWLIENRAGTTEIWIASDLQTSSWHPEDSRWKSVIAQLSALPQKVRIRLLALNQGDSKNTSIEIRELVRRVQGDQSELRFVIDLQRTIASSEPVSVTLNLDGVNSQLDVPMEGQSMRWRHKVTLPPGKARGWGSFTLPPDANRRDNSAFFVFGAETKTEGIVVSDDPVSARYLRLAASSVVNRLLVQPKVITPTEADKEDWTGASLIVWKAPLPNPTVEGQLEQFVQEGGALLFVPPGAPDNRRFHGVGWTTVESAPADKPFHVARWDENQGPLAKTDEGFSLPMTQVQFQRRQRLDGKLPVLAAFEDGTPFLGRLALGKGEVFFAGSLPNPDWSTLGEGPVFVPMMQRLLFAGTRRLRQMSSITSGELNPSLLQRKWEPVEASGRDIRTAAGIFRSGDDLVAANRPPSEDDIEVLDLNDARPLFGDISFQLLQDNRQRSDRLQGEIWRVLVIAMLLFLIGEGILILPGKAQTNGQGNERIPEKRESEFMAFSK